ncbi:hypothetical protein ACI7BZ_02495 [Xanthobacter sp. AM11]|uniref:hypothetical protein n=1 Tax=Xanthobacter sp. AM11 TaxID=3380643 RepID=UPI0039BF7127
MKLGSMLDGKRVADGKLMPIRRPQDGPLDSPDRFRRRFVDPGPRALSAQARRRASRTMARYPSSRTTFYAAEAQWPDAPFWRRRQFRDPAVA